MVQSMSKYEEWSDMSLEEEYVRVTKCSKCMKQRREIEIELTSRGYTAREIRNVRELAKH